MAPEPTTPLSASEPCQDGSATESAVPENDAFNASLTREIGDDEPLDPAIRQLDIDATECIRARDFKGLSELLPKIIAVVGQCPEVVLLMFWCAEDANSTDALQTVSQLAACYDDFKAPHIHRAAATALANAGRYEEALDICTKHCLRAESEVIRLRCEKTLKAMGLHDEAKKYRWTYATPTQRPAEAVVADV